MASTTASGATEPRTANGPAPRSRLLWWLVDLLIALGVFVYSLPLMPVEASDLARLIVHATVVVVLCVSYLWRRWYPLVVFLVMLVVASVPPLLDEHDALLAADVMLLFSVYNVASRYRWQISVPAAVAVVGWLLWAVRGSLELHWLTIGNVGVVVIAIVWLWTWGTLARTRRAYIAELQERAARIEREQAALAQVIAARERARIAREMHDVISHNLTEMVVLSDAASFTFELNPAHAKTSMEQVRDTGRAALAEMRQMLNVLRDDEPGSPLAQPGTAHLDDLVDQSGVRQ